ncbi:MAG: BTAD domain-containing putative transcriptional regulator [Alphaproteobacteria bacterium]|nr:BTAD domain-containing putative transcriptional regulator [Alphaproteobacteria bacterium]
MEPLSLRLFGDVSLLRGRSREIALPRKTQLLLAYLALSAEQRHPRDKLASLLWETRSEEQARHSLRQCLFTLGKSLGDGETPLILTDRNQLSLNRDLLEVDIWQFERHLTAGSPENLRQAAALYRGDLLAGLTFEQETLDAWCAAERTRLRDRFFETLATLTSHYADTVDLDAAIQTGRRLVNLDPLREDAHRTLIRLYQRAGRRAAALKQYQSCVEILRRDLNVEPDAATTRLYLEIRRRHTEGDASPEPTVPLPDDGPRTSHDGFPGIVQAVVRRRFLALVAGLAVLLTLAGIILWLSLWRPQPPSQTGLGQPGIIKMLT